MSPKERLEQMIRNLPPRVKKPKKEKPLNLWEEVFREVYPDYPSQKIEPKDRKIFEAICAKIDKETSVTSRDFVKYYISNYESLEGKAYPRLSSFCLGYQEHLAKYISARQRKSLNVRR